MIRISYLYRNLKIKTMYQDAHNTILELLKKNSISKISFIKSGEIQVKFNFIQNKVTYKTVIELLEAIEKIEDFIKNEEL